MSVNPPTASPVLARYALYFAPAVSHPLWQAGCHWLGRDARAGAALTPPAQAFVRQPWRYGFHATLKAPLSLAADCTEAQWLDAVRALAARHRSFRMPALHVCQLGRFVALRPRAPVAPEHPLCRLADDGVISLDFCRDRHAHAARRSTREASLTLRQQSNLAQWGYAHVLDDWRFHMTLSNPLGPADDARAESVLQAARQHFAEALAEPLMCDALCVFVEPGPGEPLVLQHRLPLGVA
jgi:hypothetical protein